MFRMLALYIYYVFWSCVREAKHQTSEGGNTRPRKSNAGVNRLLLVPAAPAAPSCARRRRRPPPPPPFYAPEYRSH